MVYITEVFKLMLVGGGFYVLMLGLIGLEYWDRMVFMCLC